MLTRRRPRHYWLTDRSAGMAGARGALSTRRNSIITNLSLLKFAKYSEYSHFSSKIRLFFYSNDKIVWIYVNFVDIPEFWGIFVHFYIKELFSSEQKVAHLWEVPKIFRRKENRSKMTLKILLVVCESKFHSIHKPKHV